MLLLRPTSRRRNFERLHLYDNLIDIPKPNRSRSVIRQRCRIPIFLLFGIVAPQALSRLSAVAGLVDKVCVGILVCVEE